MLALLTVHTCRGACNLDQCSDRPLYECSLHACGAQTSFSLANEQLSGTVPPELATLSGSLLLNSNELTGQIPSAFGALTSLAALNLRDNVLHGSVPPSLGSLGQAALTLLDLRSNQLTGFLPTSICSLDNGETTVYLSSNMFACRPRVCSSWLLSRGATDVSSRCSSRALYTCSLETCSHYDYSYSPITDMTSSGLWGTIPSTLASIEYFDQTFDFYGNQLTGTLPPAFMNASYVNNSWGLLLDYNEISGELPSFLSSLSGLTQLDLQGNELKGTIPLSLGSFGSSSLTLLDLRSNQLTGFLPTSICSLDNGETTVYVSSNTFACRPRVCSSWLLSRGAADVSSRCSSRALYTCSLETCSHYNYSYSPITDMTSSGLWGTIPSTLASIEYFDQTFDFYGNQLTGTLPPAFMNASYVNNSWGLLLDYNEISGELPSFLSSLSGLTQLDLQGNELKGTIPLSLGSFGSSSLTLLDLRSNQLTGFLPTSICSLDNGETTVYVSSNTFACRPRVCSSWLLSRGAADVSSRCSSRALYTCSLETCSHYNYSYSPITDMTSSGLWGTIPSTLASIEYFDQTFDFYGNQLTGTLPPAFMNASYVNNSWGLLLDYNEISGELPSFLSSLSGLTQLDLQGNELKGTIPLSLGSFGSSSLTLLDLRSNQLTGFLPTSICSLDNGETTVYVSSNTFACRPRVCSSWLLSRGAADVSSRCSSRALYTCSLETCSHYNYSYSPITDLTSSGLWGTIPSTLASIEYFDQTFDFYGNQLTGTLPPAFMNASYVNNSWGLLLDYNEISGELPSFLSSLSGLTQLDLQGNELKGTIPLSLGSFGSSSLTLLDLRSNQLTGFLPTSICSLDNGETTVYVSSNTFACRPRVCSSWLLSRGAADVSSRCSSRALYTCSLETCSHYNYSYSPITDMTSSGLWGTIPSTLASIEYFDQTFDFYGNQLTGTLPPSLGSSRWSGPWGFAAEYNELTGSLPRSWGSMSGLTLLDLQANALVGSIPRSFGLHLRSLSTLDLRTNKLSGFLPRSICSLTSIDTCALSSNLFWCELPCPDDLRSGCGLSVCEDGYTRPPSTTSNPLPTTGEASTAAAALPTTVMAASSSVGIEDSTAGEASTVAAAPLATAVAAGSTVGIEDSTAGDANTVATALPTTAVAAGSTVGIEDSTTGDASTVAAALPTTVVAAGSTVGIEDSTAGEASTVATAPATTVVVADSTVGIEDSTAGEVSTVETVPVTTAVTAGSTVGIKDSTAGDANTVATALPTTAVAAGSTVGIEDSTTSEASTVAAALPTTVVAAGSTVGIEDSTAGEASTAATAPATTVVVADSTVGIEDSTAGEARTVETVPATTVVVAGSTVGIEDSTAGEARTVAAATTVMAAGSTVGIEDSTAGEVSTVETVPATTVVVAGSTVGIEDSTAGEASTVATAPATTVVVADSTVGIEDSTAGEVSTVETVPATTVVVAGSTVGIEDSTAGEARTDAAAPATTVMAAGSTVGIEDSTTGDASTVAAALPTTVVAAGSTVGIEDSTAGEASTVATAPATTVVVADSTVGIEDSTAGEVSTVETVPVTTAVTAGSTVGIKDSTAGEASTVATALPTTAVAAGSTVGIEDSTAGEARTVAAAPATTVLAAGSTVGIEDSTTGEASTVAAALPTTVVAAGSTVGIEDSTAGEARTVPTAPSTTVVAATSMGMITSSSVDIAMRPSSTSPTSRASTPVYTTASAFTFTPTSTSSSNEDAYMIFHKFITSDALPTFFQGAEVWQNMSTFELVHIAPFRKEAFGALVTIIFTGFPRIAEDHLMTISEFIREHSGIPVGDIKTCWEPGLTSFENVVGLFVPFSQNGRPQFEHAASGVTAIASAVASQAGHTLESGSVVAELQGSDGWSSLTGVSVVDASAAGTSPRDGTVFVTCVVYGYSSLTQAQVDSLAGAVSGKFGLPVGSIDAVSQSGVVDGEAVVGMMVPAGVDVHGVDVFVHGSGVTAIASAVASQAGHTLESGSVVAELQGSDGWSSLTGVSVVDASAAGTSPRDGTVFVTCVVYGYSSLTQAQVDSLAGAVSGKFGLPVGSIDAVSQSGVVDGEAVVGMMVPAGVDVHGVDVFVHGSGVTAIASAVASQAGHTLESGSVVAELQGSDGWSSLTGVSVVDASAAGTSPRDGTVFVTCVVYGYSSLTQAQVDSLAGAVSGKFGLPVGSIDAVSQSGVVDGEAVVGMMVPAGVDVHGVDVFVHGSGVTAIASAVASQAGHTLESGSVVAELQGSDGWSSLTGVSVVDASAAGTSPRDGTVFVTCVVYGYSSLTQAQVDSLAGAVSGKFGLPVGSIDAVSQSGVVDGEAVVGMMVPAGVDVHGVDVFVHGSGVTAIASAVASQAGHTLESGSVVAELQGSDGWSSLTGVSVVDASAAGTSPRDGTVFVTCVVYGYSSLTQAQVDSLAGAVSGKFGLPVGSIDAVSQSGVVDGEAVVGMMVPAGVDVHGVDVFVHGSGVTAIASAVASQAGHTLESGSVVAELQGSDGWSSLTGVSVVDASAAGTSPRDGTVFVTCVVYGYSSLTQAQVDSLAGAVSGKFGLPVGSIDAVSQSGVVDGEAVVGMMVPAGVDVHGVDVFVHGSGVTAIASAVASQAGHTLESGSVVAELQGSDGWSSLTGVSVVDASAAGTSPRDGTVFVTCVVYGYSSLTQAQVDSLAGAVSGKFGLPVGSIDAVSQSGVVDGEAVVGMMVPAGVDVHGVDVFVHGSGVTAIASAVASQAGHTLESGSVVAELQGSDGWSSLTGVSVVDASAAGTSPRDGTVFVTCVVYGYSSLTQAQVDSLAGAVSGKFGLPVGSIDAVSQSGVVDGEAVVGMMVPAGVDVHGVDVFVHGSGVTAIASAVASQAGHTLESGSVVAELQGSDGWSSLTGVSVVDASAAGTSPRDGTVFVTCVVYGYSSLTQAQVDSLAGAVSGKFGLPVGSIDAVSQSGVVDGEAVVGMMVPAGVDVHGVDVFVHGSGVTAIASAVASQAGHTLESGSVVAELQGSDGWSSLTGVSVVDASAAGTSPRDGTVFVTCVVYGYSSLTQAQVDSLAGAVSGKFGLPVGSIDAVSQSGVVDGEAVVGMMVPAGVDVHGVDVFVHGSGVTAIASAVASQAGHTLESGSVVAELQGSDGWSSLTGVSVVDASAAGTSPRDGTVFVTCVVYGYSSLTQAQVDSLAGAVSGKFGLPVGSIDAVSQSGVVDGEAVVGMMVPAGVDVHGVDVFVHGSGVTAIASAVASQAGHTLESGSVVAELQGSDGWSSLTGVSVVDASAAGTSPRDGTVFVTCVVYGYSSLTQAQVDSLAGAVSGKFGLPVGSIDAVSQSGVVDGEAVVGMMVPAGVDVHGVDVFVHGSGVTAIASAVASQAGHTLESGSVVAELQGSDGWSNLASIIVSAETASTFEQHEVVSFVTVTLVGVYAVSEVNLDALKDAVTGRLVFQVSRVDAVAQVHGRGVAPVIGIMLASASNNGTPSVSGVTAIASGTSTLVQEFIRSEAFLTALAEKEQWDALEGVLVVDASASASSLNDGSAFVTVVVDGYDSLTDSQLDILLDYISETLGISMDGAAAVTAPGYDDQVAVGLVLPSWLGDDVPDAQAALLRAASSQVKSLLVSPNVVDSLKEQPGWQSLRDFQILNTSSSNKSSVVAARARGAEISFDDDLDALSIILQDKLAFPVGTMDVYPQVVDDMETDIVVSMSFDPPQSDSSASFTTPAVSSTIDYVLIIAIVCIVVVVVVVLVIVLVFVVRCGRASKVVAQPGDRAVIAERNSLGLEHVGRQPRSRKSGREVAIEMKQARRAAAPARADPLPQNDLTVSQTQPTISVQTTHAI